MEANAQAGVLPTLKITPDYIRKRFVADITDRTERNEGLIRRGHQPAMTVEGGKGYWTYPRLKEALRFLDQMEIRDQKTGEYKFEELSHTAIKKSNSNIFKTMEGFCLCSANLQPHLYKSLNLR